MCVCGCVCIRLLSLHHSVLKPTDEFIQFDVQRVLAAQPHQQPPERSITTPIPPHRALEVCVVRMTLRRRMTGPVGAPNLGGMSMCADVGRVLSRSVVGQTVAV